MTLDDAYYLVYKDLTSEDGMLTGVYDAKHGNRHYMNGIWTVMELIAYKVGNDCGYAFNDRFSANMAASEAKVQSGSEIPNKCETCKHNGRWENEHEYGYPSPCTGCVHRASSHYEPKTEPQTDYRRGYIDAVQHIADELVRQNLHIAPNEPQADYTPDCPFCKRYGTEDCLGSDCRHYKTYKDEPQTDCETCKYGQDKHRYAYICNECGVGINNYEPKDEPQTGNLFTDKDGDVWEWHGDSWYCISSDESQTERSE